LKTNWQIIGRLEDETPFFFTYSDPGYTNWWCPIRLGDAARKKILGHVRDELRRAEVLPPYIKVHDLSSQPCGHVAEKAAVGDSGWRSLMTSGVVNILTIGMRTMLCSQFHYVEKEQAKALGVTWNGSVWRVKRQGDMTPFSRWMTAPDVAVTAKQC
jgi:hypothetical protein